VTGTLVGYARISTTQQSLDQQHDALTLAGTMRIFSDTMSGARDDRPELAALLDYVREGDTVVVVALDRLGRTLSGIFRTVDQLAAKGVHIRTLREGIDSATPIGRLFMAFFAGIAEYERTLILERSNVARQAARDRGKLPGRPRALNPDQQRTALALRETDHSIPDIMRILGVSRSTLYRYLAAQPS
jgi:DNA invertase Pin-like site-specific DNA recombinase